MFWGSKREEDVGLPWGRGAASSGGGLQMGSPPLGKILLIDVSYINGVNKGLNKNDLHIHADAKEDLLHHTSIRFLHQLLYSLVQTDINGCVCFSLQHLENNENHLPSAQEIHHPL